MLALWDPDTDEDTVNMQVSLLQVRQQLVNRSQGSRLEQSYLDAPLADRLKLMEETFTSLPAIAAAFRLKLWEAIPADSGATFEEVVQRTMTSSKGMDVLLQALINLGAITYNKTSKRFYNEYTRTAANAKFETEVMGKSFAMQRQLFYTAESVREGRAVGLSNVFGNYESIYEARADIPELAQAWDPWMDLRSTKLAERFSFIYKLPSVVARGGSDSKLFNGRVLDWCGNDGKNAIRLARSDPTMRLTVLDLPAQVTKAAAAIKEAGLSSQIDTKGVDLLDGDPTFEHRYDAVFMIHMLSEWPKKDVARFFKIIKSILNPGGVVVLFSLYKHHPVGDFTDVHPDALSEKGWFPLYMLTSASHTSFPKTHDQLGGMLTEAGFVDVARYADADNESVSLVAATPKATTTDSDVGAATTSFQESSSIKQTERQRDEIERETVSTPKDSDRSPSS